MICYRQILLDALYQVDFELSQFRLAESGKVAVIEPETLRRHQGAGLFHMFTQMLAQGRVQQVRGGVVTGNLPAPVRVNGQPDCLAHLDLTFFNCTLVDNDLVGQFLHIGNRNEQFRAADLVRYQPPGRRIQHRMGWTPPQFPLPPRL